MPPGWVQCDDCDKWRRVSDVDAVGDTWTCADGAPGVRRPCSVPQDPAAYAEDLEDDEEDEEEDDEEAELAILAAAAGKKRSRPAPAQVAAGHVDAESAAAQKQRCEEAGVDGEQYGVSWDHENKVVLDIAKQPKLPGGGCRLRALFFVVSFIMTARVDDEDLDQIAEAALDPRRARAKGRSAQEQVLRDEANHTLLKNHGFFDTLTNHVALHSSTSYWGMGGGAALLRCAYRVASAYLRIERSEAYHHPACEFGLYAAFIGFYGRGSSKDEKAKIKEWLTVQRAAIKEFARRVDGGHDFFPHGGKIILAELASVDELLFDAAWTWGGEA